MTQVSLIEQLKEQGNSIRSISRKTGLHRKTVARYLCDSSVSVESDVVSPPENYPCDNDLREKSLPSDDRLSLLKGYFPYFDGELSRRGVILVFRPLPYIRMVYGSVCILRESTRRSIISCTRH